MKWNLKIIIRKTWFQILILILVTFLAFSNVFPNEFVGDDIDFFIKWEDIRSWSNLGKILKGSTPLGHEEVYRPLRGVIYLIEYSLVGQNRFFYHFQSILIHIIVTVLIYLVVTKISKKNLLAFFVSIFFGLHPIHTEMITFIAGSMDSFAFIFFFGTILLYLKVREKKKRWKLEYGFSLILSLMAFTTYEVTLTLPIILLIYEFIFGKVNKKNVRGKIVMILPYFLILFTYFFVRFFMAGIVERNIYQAGSFGQTMIVNVKVLIKYLSLLLLPVNLSLNHKISEGIYAHTFPKYNWQAISKLSFFDWDILAGLFFLLFLIYWAFKNRGKYKYLSFGILWFLAGFLPTLNIVPHASLLAERYAYIPSLGICIFLGWLVSNFIESKVKWKKKAGFSAGILLAIFLLFLTYQRNKDWINEVTLWKQAEKLTPDNSMVLFKLGSAYKDEGNLEEAKKYYLKTIKLSPDFVHAYNNLGVMIEQEGEVEKAQEYYLKALEYEPDLEEALNNLGVLYRKKGDLNKATEYYKKALEINKDNPSAQFNLVETYNLIAMNAANEEDWQKALDNFFLAYELNHNNVEILNNIGSIYARTKDYEKAIEYYQKALKIKPDFEEARKNLEKANNMNNEL